MDLTEQLENILSRESDRTRALVLLVRAIREGKDVPLYRAQFIEAEMGAGLARVKLELASQEASHG